MKRGKKYLEKSKLVDKANLYDLDAACALIPQVSTAKFDETVEAHIRLGVDSRHADQQVRGAVVLPHGTGKTIRVLVFAKGAKADEAQAAGADYVGAEDLVAKIQNENWFDFDVVVATPDMMGLVGRIGRVLGPKGLMPNLRLVQLLWTLLRLSKILRLVRLNTVLIRQTLSTFQLVRFLSVLKSFLKTFRLL